MRNNLFHTIIGVAFCCISIASANNVADIVVYNSVDWHSNVVVKRVDLDRNEIIQNTQLPFGGEIISKHPLRIDNTSRNLVITTDGVPCKNCEGFHPISYYAIMDDYLNLVHIDSIPHVGIYDVIMSRNDSLILLVTEPIGDSGISTHYAKYTFSNNFLIKESTVPSTFKPDNTPAAGIYNNLRNLGNNRGNTFWAMDDNFDMHLINVNPLNHTVRNDIIIGDIVGYSQLISFSQESTVIYAFSLSYDIPHGGGVVSERNARPSYVKKYSILSFQQLDSIPVPNLVSDSEYTSNEHGLCNQQGPYLYHYFFKSDDYRYFSPAMLFIFDTRTNEARWLRVGWR